MHTRVLSPVVESTPCAFTSPAPSVFLPGRGSWIEIWLPVIWRQPAERPAQLGGIVGLAGGDGLELVRQGRQ